MVRSVAFSSRGVAVAIGLLALVFSSSARPGQEKVLLSIKADAGQVVRYSATTNITINFGGETLVIESKDVTLTTYKAVGADGSVTYENKTESSQTTMNGEPMEDDEPAKPSTVTLNNRGELVGYESDMGDDENASLSTRLLVGGSPVFPTTPVGPGDTWTHEYQANEKLMTRKAKAEFTYVANETIGTTPTAKITMSFREAGGSPALTVMSTLWVEIATGDVVQSEQKLENVPFSGGGQSFMARGTNNTKRTNGNPVKSLQDPNEKPAEETDSIDAKVKDFEKIDGLFPIYRQTKNGRTTLYLEIREEQLNKLHMLQATASTGTSDRVVAGNPINDIVFEFRRMPNEKIYMVVPNYLFRARPGLPIDQAVKRSFAESFLETFSVEAKQKDRNSILIDVSDFFRGDIAQVSALFQGGGNPFLGGGGLPSYNLDREKTFIKEVKGFPTNVFVATTYNFQGGGGNPNMFGMGGARTTPDSRSVALTVNYNLFALPTGNGYVPRVYDRRVGYFTNSFQDFSNDRAKDQTVQFINRWHLVKKDPAAAVSEPVEPITFWLDSAIPTTYREAVRAGFLCWNEAFEKAGFKNAVVVKDMPANADFDHADMRYNVVRWVASPGDAYAVALFRTNPITGQILNASITVDANIVRVFAGEYSQAINPGAWSGKTAEDHKAVCDDPTHCTAARDAIGNARIGLVALRALGLTQSQVSEVEYIRQFVTWVVSHEFGHVLGLRHNFVASTELDLTQLGDRSRVEQMATSASVMDYIPFNPSAIRNSGVRFWGDRVGTYDRWAIQYGYMTTGLGTDAEVPRLKQLASQCNLPGHKYNSDEFADSFDPTVTRFDLSKRPIEYHSRMAAMARHLLMSADKIWPKNGESYYVLTQNFESLVGLYVMSAMQNSRYLGGVIINANFRGDAGEQPTIQTISPAEQRAALQMINSNIFSPTAFAFPKTVYEKLTQNPNATLDSFEPLQTFPARDMFANAQAMILRSVLSPGTLGRIGNQEFKARRPDGSLTIAEVMRSVGQNVWADAAGSAEIPALRRQLQNEHLDILIGFALRPGSNVPADARTLAWDELRRIRTIVRGGIGKSRGSYTPAHLRNVLMRIDRTLNAVETLGGGSGASMPSLLDLLGGGAKKGG